MDPTFTPTIQEIWDRHRSQNILCRALGPDPVIFANEVIQAWEAHKAQETVRLSTNVKQCL